MCGRHLTSVWVALLLLAVPASRAAAQQPQPQAQPAFHTAVDIIPIDVTVLDGRGGQVTDLQADAFSVTVDGRPRHIVSSRYIGYSGRPAAQSTTEELPRSSALRVSTNQEPPGRLVMVVVDGAGIDFGASRTAIEGLKRFLATLGPKDAVGLSVLPYNGVAVPFTSDHARVVQAMTQLSGRSARYQRTTEYQVGWAEALDREQRREAGVWGAVVARECADCRDKPCVELCSSMLAAEADSMVGEMRQRLFEFSAGMRDLLSYLRAIDSPKTVILLSSGLVATPADSEIDGVGKEANAAGCSIYALNFNPWDAPDASERKPSPSHAADIDLRRTSLELLAGRTRGWVFDVYGSAGAPFEKLSAEMAGFYLLGVEPEPSDRDGKTHQIKVVVSRNNVSVRGRRDLIWRQPSRDARSPLDAVRAMLASPVAANDVPLRVTSYTGPAQEAGKLQVVISAEVGRDSAPPEEFTVGWSLVAANGKVGGAGSQKVTLKPVVGRAGGPLSYVTAPLVDAGRYTLRLAVLDSAGRGGSVTHEVEAQLRSAGPLATGDLVIGTPPGSASSFEPPVKCVVAGDRLFVYLPVTSTEPRTLAATRATIEIARDEQDRALLQSAAALAGKRSDQRALQVSVGLRLLPPGSYVARVLLTARGAVVATASREFVFAPAPAAAGLAGTSAAGAADAEIAAPRFALADVLNPRTLAPFLDRASRVAPDLPASVFVDARAGRFGAAVSGLPADAGGPVPPFLRGLALLDGADLEGAAREFRDSRRASLEFADAVVFLGVCFVAGGKDDEAVGALQTARFGLDDEPTIYRLLIDARMRRHQFEQAKDLAEEAARRWPDEARFQVQFATVLAAANEAPRALAVLDGYLPNHNDDVQALFLALRLLYASATGPNGKPDAVIERFRDYAARYDAANGPERALVAEWLKYLTR